MDWWEYLESHPISGNAVQDLPDVKKIAEHEWARIQDLCHLNDVTLHVDFDESVFQDLPRVLATASRTMYLINDEWQPGALNDLNMTGSIVIKVNPNVPNGWYVYNDTNPDQSCDTGYRFDLTTVIRHELLHGIGISSSIHKNSIGYNYADNCYITSFDHHIKTTENENYLNGCSLSVTRTADAYVSGIKLYNPATFKIGSSFSHVDSSGLMYFKIPPMKCYDYDSNVFTLLNDLGAHCPEMLTNANPYTNEIPVIKVNSTVSDASSRNVNFSVYIFMFLVLKCLMTRLRI